MHKVLKNCLVLIAFSASSLCLAQTLTMHLTAAQGQGADVGTVEITETAYGLLFSPHLHDLKPGVHGFHIHEKPDCGNSGMAAGGHFDPDNTGHHLGPYDARGHLGDLPALYVNSDGTSTLPILAPRLSSLGQIKSRALMIHNGGDNYSDLPQALGGGDGRMVCAVLS